MCLAHIFAANPRLRRKVHVSPHACTSRLSIVCDLCKKGIDCSRIAPLRSTVVCTESIPAYVGVVVRGCHSRCMSGSFAGQLRISQILDFLGDEGLEGCLIALPKALWCT